MTSRRLMPALPVVVAAILLLAVAWSLVVVQTRPGPDASAALRAQGNPDGQVVTFTAGRIDPGQADIRPNEAAYVGSVSKTFTAAMTLRLVDRGVLRIDDPVVTHLPAFRVQGPREETEAITVRMLLELEKAGYTLRQSPSPLRGGVRGGGKRYQPSRKRCSTLHIFSPGNPLACCTQSANCSSSTSSPSWIWKYRTAGYFEVTGGGGLSALPLKNVTFT